MTLTFDLERQGHILFLIVDYLDVHVKFSTSTFQDIVIAFAAWSCPLALEVKVTFVQNS